MTRARLLAAALSVGSGLSVWAGDARPSLYLVELELIPATGQLAAAAELTLEREDYLEPELRFRLNASLRIELLEVNGQAVDYAVAAEAERSSSSASNMITAALPEELRRPRITLKTAYAGAMAASSAAGRDDPIGPRRVELTRNSIWYPQFGTGTDEFASDLVITLPKDWEVASTGKRVSAETVEGHERSRWITQSGSDLVLVASPDFELVSVSNGGVSVEIYQTRLPVVYVARESENTRKTLEFYRAWLGEPSGEEQVLRVVYSPRAAGQGGYTHPPLIVLSEGLVIDALRADSRLSLIRGTAHEAAHFWWNFGTGQGDWINESFAEYFALLVLERIDAPERYHRTIAAYTAEIKELPASAPSLAEVPADNQNHGYAIRYRKGALMLHEFRQVMGNDAFLRACRDFYELRLNQPTGTEDFEEFWSSRLGEHAGLLNRWLHSRGGTPTAE